MSRGSGAWLGLYQALLGLRPIPLRLAVWGCDVDRGAEDKPDLSGTLFLSIHAAGRSSIR